MIFNILRRENGARTQHSTNSNLGENCFIRLEFLTICLLYFALRMVTTPLILRLVLLARVTVIYLFQIVEKNELEAAQNYLEQAARANLVSSLTHVFEYLFLVAKQTSHSHQAVLDVACLTGLSSHIRVHRLSKMK